MRYLGWLVANLYWLGVWLNLIKVRRCCGCGKTERQSERLIGCYTILNKRVIARDSHSGVIHCTLSRLRWVVPLVCPRCKSRIDELQSAMVLLEVRIRVVDGQVVSTYIAETRTGHSLPAVVKPELSLTPPYCRNVSIGVPS